MKRVYISDTNIWIDFRHADLLDELFQLPFTLCCTDFVLNELKDFHIHTLLAKGLRVESLDSHATARLFPLMQAHNNSSLADVSCYLLAKETHRPLLTGDGRLRKQAIKDGLPVHGAIWLLDQLLVNQVITPSIAAERLESMLAHGARLPSEACHTRLTQWKT